MKCEYCDNVVDASLSICPHCGANMPKVVVVKKVVTKSMEPQVEKKQNSKFINLFLYAVIGIGIILILVLIALRYI